MSKVFFKFITLKNLFSLIVTFCFFDYNIKQKKKRDEDNYGF